jgi:hypothetical protein
VDDQLHPQLGDLVLDDEQHLVVVRRIDSGCCARRSVVMPASSARLLVSIANSPEERPRSLAATETVTTSR